MNTELDKEHCKILRYIKRHPYTSYAKLNGHFRNIIMLFDKVCFLENESYISFRSAADPRSDEGSVTYGLRNDSHLVVLRQGNVIMEDRALFRANMALVLSALALFVSVTSNSTEILNTFKSLLALLPSL